MARLNNYTDILSKEIRDQFRAVIELVAQLQGNMGTLAKATEMEDVKNDVKVIKKVVTDISRQQTDHEGRISRLEAINHA